MEEKHITAVNKNGALGRFSKHAWELMKNKLGWTEVGSQVEVKIPMEVTKILEKNHSKEESAIYEGNLKAESKKIIIENVMTPEAKRKLITAMKAELKEAGIPVHHASGYNKTKKAYNDYQKQQNG